MYPKKKMRLEIMLCLQLLSALTTGSKSTFELLARRKHDFSMYLFKKAEMMSTRVDACAVNCARNPRCSVFKYDMLASLCTTFAPDRFRRASTGDLEAQLGYYAYTDRGWCPVEYGYIFLRDVQMCIWLSPTPVTKDSAVTQCSRYGDRLVVLSDFHKWEAISKMSLGSSTLLQVGADDSAVQGTYLWGDGRPVNGSLWDAGEPNRLTEHCVYIKNGKLSDYPCSWHAKFICEKYN